MQSTGGLADGSPADRCRLGALSLRRCRHGVQLIGRALALALFSMIISIPSRADLIESVGMMIDERGTFAIADAAASEFESIGSTVTLGYTSAAVWLRLRIRAAPKGHTVLIVRPPMLDDVQLFAPADTAAVAASPSMPAYERRDPDWPSTLRGFRLSPSHDGTDYYLRVASHGTLAIDVAAMAEDNAIQSTITTELIKLSYFFIMLFVSLWAIVMVFMTNNKLFISFAIAQLIWVIHNFFFMNYYSIVLTIMTTENAHYLFRILVFLSLISTLLFHRIFLQTFEPHKLSILLFDFLTALSFFATISAIFIDLQLGLRISYIIILSSPFAILFSVFTMSKDSIPGLFLTRSLYIILAAHLSLWSGYMLAFNNIRLFTLYGFMMHGIMTGIILTFLLHLYRRSLAKEAATAKQRVAELEQRRRIEQEQIRTVSAVVQMLSHESRNALAVLNMTLATAVPDRQRRDRVLATIRDLSAVINRCKRALELDNIGLTVDSKPCDIRALLEESRHVKQEPGRIVINAPSSARLNTDPILLGFVFDNLLDNAVKYASPGSTILVTTGFDRAMVSIVFENKCDPQAIPDPDRIFTKYYRHPRARSNIGSGLGLYIVHGLVRLLGGDIAYEADNQQIRFRVQMRC